MAGSFLNVLHRLRGTRVAITFDSTMRVGTVTEVGSNYVVLEADVEGGGTESLAIQIDHVSCAKPLEFKAEAKND